MESVEAEHLNDNVMLSVDREGVSYLSGVEEIIPLSNSEVIPVNVEELTPCALDYSDVLFIGTQQSSNRYNTGKAVYVDLSSGDEEVDIGFTDDFVDDMFPFNPDEHNRLVHEELEMVKKLKRQKREKKEKDVTDVSAYNL